MRVQEAETYIWPNPKVIWRQNTNKCTSMSAHSNIYKLEDYNYD